MNSPSCELRQAVVLCAGRGRRLGELTQCLPKPMLPVDGRPLVSHIVSKLVDEAGFAEVVLVIGRQGACIGELFQQEPRVQIAHQTQPLGTADALLAATHLLDGHFFLTYGDLWVAAAEYRNLRRCASWNHRLWLAVNSTDRPAGAAVYLQKGRVERIVEKPDWTHEPDTRWNAAGLYVLDRGFLDDCRAVRPSIRGELELSSAIQLAVDRGTEFHGYALADPQVDIGTPERFHTLCATLNNALSTSSVSLADHPKSSPDRAVGSPLSGGTPTTTTASWSQRQ